MPKPQSAALRGALGAFAPKLNHLLERRGLSQSELGRQLKRRGQGVAPKTINNLANELHSAQIGNMAEIADFLDVPLWVMLVPDLPLEVLQGDQLKRLAKLMQDYVACDADGRRHTENIAAAHTKRKGK